MQTFTSRRGRAGDLANNSSATTLSLADSLMNACEKRILSARDWPFLWRQFTQSTTASTMTVTIATPGVFTLSNHGLAVNSVVYFSTTGALPTGLTAVTAYYIIAAGLTASAFEVSTTLGGTAVNTTGTQSGTHTITTQNVLTTAYMERPKSVYVTVGNYRYAPDEVSSRAEWDELNQVQIASNIPTKWFWWDDGVQLFPKQTSSNVITFNSRLKLRDLSIADYTTGTVDIVTNGSTTVTGSGTTWTTQMVGRWIQITPSNTANSGGDGYWYEIAQVTSATVLVLKKPYGGLSLTTGAAAAYTIGQASLIPEPHDMLPVYDFLRIFFTSVDPDMNKSKMYTNFYNEGYAQMTKDWGAKVNVVLDDGGGDNDINPNFFVSY